MDEIEQLLEGGKAEAAAQKATAQSPSNGHRYGSGDEGKSERKRDTSPSARSHTSSHRSHRRRRDRSVTPRGDRADSRSRRDSSRDRDSRRSSRRHRDDDDDRRSVHSSSSKRDRDGRSDDRDDEDRKRRRRSPSRSDSHNNDRDDRYRPSHRSSRRDDSRERRSDRDRDYRRRDRDDRDRRSYGRDSRDRRDSRRDDRDRDSGRTDSPGSGGRMTEEEHEARSVFVTQLAARIGDRELFQFFEQNVGKVRDARVILDRVSRRSKGVAYVEFIDIEDVRKAINLTGTKLLGIPIVVQYTEAERNRQAGLVQRQNVPDHITVPPGSDARGDAPVPWNRIYVGSLPFSLRENDIRQIFEPFGPIDSVDLHFDNITQKSKGYCFVQYRMLADAQQALERMNGFEIAGRPIRVGLVTEKGSSTSTQSANPAAPNMRQGGGGGMMRPDSLEEGANLNSISRIELMQKLARTEPTNTLSAPTRPMFRVNVPTATSKSVLLKHMFNPAEETEKDWDLDLRDDVKSECESKYGPVVEIRVVKDSSDGEIYVRFDTIETAAKAIQGLNGRFFGGQQISAQYISDALFDAHRK